ncbi:MAG: tetratricopeptide repeat protein [Nitrospirae bacterium]|nr:MAG: tetratricopeptide repeat protein [Nitrospirota bacterium]
MFRTTRFIVILTVLVLLSNCASLETERQKEAESHYKMAISHLNEGEYQPAYVELEKAIRLNPEEKRAYYALGIVYHYFEEYSKAEDSLKKAISLDPTYSEAYNLLGLVLIKLKRMDEAIEAFKKALDNPLYQHPEKAFTNLGNLYYRKGDFKVALEYYKKALKRAPRYPVAYYGIALSYNALERFGDASEALREAIKLDPEIGGDVGRAEEVFTRKKLSSTSREEEQDYIDLLDILHY